jgi:hypothetical protein
MSELESGYRFATIYGRLTPYAAIQAQNFHTPSYSETDLNGGGSRWALTRATQPIRAANWVDASIGGCCSTPRPRSRYARASPGPAPARCDIRGNNSERRRHTLSALGHVWTAPD